MLEATASKRPFARPQRLLPFRSLHSRVNDPGLLLRDLPARLIARSAFSSPASTGLPQLRAASSLQARCGLPLRFAQLLPLPPLPFRTFTSLWIEAFNRFRCLAAHLPNPPDFLSLPAAFLFLVLAADHRSWIATFPEACCSSNLLEPSSLCRQVPFSSMAFACCEIRFPQHLSTFISIWLQS